ncbi:MAG: hypothetical protein E7571_05225 [Ruminococcaceae bacterium]|nr:hypothetical protein [Oscillospiraceae bacterium]
MKKTLSLALSFIMLITSMTAFGTSVFAATIADATEITLDGEPLEINVPVMTEPKTEAEAEEMAKNMYYCKFTPEETDYYEFIFDETFTKTSTGAVMSAIVRAEDEEPINMGIWMKLPDDLFGDDDIIGGALTDFATTINVASKLEAGKTYAIGVANSTTAEITTTVKVQKHTHNLKTFTEKSYVDDEDFYFNEDGEKYTGCTVNNCDYHKTIEKYYKVKSVKLSTTAYTYNNKLKKPAVTVKDSKGNTLKKGTDYTVTYAKNKNVGTAKATIRFKGKYEGVVVRNFKINPKGTSIAKLTAKKKGFTVKVKKQATQTTGYQIQYSTSAKFTKKTTKTVTVKGTKNVSKTVSKLKGKKKYYVRVRTYKRVSNKNYCSAWSKVKTIKTKK